MLTDLEHLVDLRLRSAPAESPDIPAARRFLTDVYGPLLARRAHIQRLERNGRWTGLVLVTEPAPSRFGVPESSVLVLLDPAAPDIHPWATSALKHLAPAFDEHCSLELNAADAVLLPTVTALGFGCAKVDLIGRVKVALERLRQGRVDPADHGIVFSTPRVEQAKEINELVRDFFLDHPEFGWGGPIPNAREQAEIDHREQERLEHRLAKGPDTDFVVCRDGRILGTFWFVQHAAHPLLGNFAGLNIMLQREVQGLGLGKAAYFHMIEHVHRSGAEFISGRTSNPGVIHIGRTIGRWLRRMILRLDGPFMSERLLNDLVSDTWSRAEANERPT